MPSAQQIGYLLVHPSQLKSIIQWKVWHDPVHARDTSKESTELKRCFDLLNLTSRSFSSVIQELHPELLVPVSLFYLALRGLDTVEDDMTIPLSKKEPILRSFAQVFKKPGWTFTESGPDEKDRQLLVEFDVVILEFNNIKPAYQDVILDITQKMGDGMADYVKNAEHNKNSVNTIKDYDLYCHYVAGLVGEGLTRLFVESKLANPALLERDHLHESMGLFLQKTNIIRDVREDFDDKRKFWPTEIWSKHVDTFDKLFAPGYEEAALNCISDMCLDALRHVDDCLFYLAGLKEQSVFNFCAIPQVMAIATLERVFRNPDVFKKNVKITKGDACQLMLDAQNLRAVCDIFKGYVRKIHHRNTPSDPNFFNISIACGKIERWMESIFPTEQPASSVAEGQVIEKSAEGPPQSFILMVSAITLTALALLMVGVAYLAMFVLENTEMFNGGVIMSDPSKHGDL